MMHATVASTSYICILSKGPFAASSCTHPTFAVTQCRQLFAAAIMILASTATFFTSNQLQDSTTH
jgi:hypothetical protein